MVIDKSEVYTAGEGEGAYIMLKPPLFIRDGKRVLVGAHSTARIGCGVFYSDDDGVSWKRSQFVNSPPHQAGGVHKGARWNHGAVEPTVIELQDGRIWMLARTAQDQHYESFSEDGAKLGGNATISFLWNHYYAHDEEVKHGVCYLFGKYYTLARKRG